MDFSAQLREDMRRWNDLKTKKSQQLVVLIRRQNELTLKWKAKREELQAQRDKYENAFFDLSSELNNIVLEILQIEASTDALHTLMNTSVVDAHESVHYTQALPLVEKKNSKEGSHTQTETVAFANYLLPLFKSWFVGKDHPASLEEAWAKKADQKRSIEDARKAIEEIIPKLLRVKEGKAQLHTNHVTLMASIGSIDALLSILGEWGFL